MSRLHGRLTNLEKRAGPDPTGPHRVYVIGPDDPRPEDGPDVLIIELVPGEFRPDHPGNDA